MKIASYAGLLGTYITKVNVILIRLAQYDTGAF